LRERPARALDACPELFVDEKSISDARARCALRALNASTTIVRSVREALRARPARKKDWHLCALTD
jgi:hypothetical protein